MKTILQEIVMASFAETGMGRRQVIAGAVATAALLPLASVSFASTTTPATKFPPLPYPENALAPAISSETVNVHYGKHHRGYFDKMVKLIENSEFANRSVEDIIRSTAGKPSQVELFNNAAPFWNHNVSWNSMRPNGGGKPPAALAARIDQAFGSHDGFKKAFAEAANGQFGSGYAWLVENNDKKLQIVKTSNADTPLVQGMTCLLNCDVWEHAYYLDYKNLRADYVSAWLDKLVNWGFVEENLTA